MKKELMSLPIQESSDEKSEIAQSNFDAYYKYLAETIGQIRHNKVNDYKCVLITDNKAIRAFTLYYKIYRISFLTSIFQNIPSSRERLVITYYDEDEFLKNRDLFEKENRIKNNNFIVTVNID